MKIMNTNTMEILMLCMRVYMHRLKISRNLKPRKFYKEYKWVTKEKINLKEQIEDIKKLTFKH